MRVREQVGMDSLAPLDVVPGVGLPGQRGELLLLVIAMAKLLPTRVVPVCTPG